MFIVVGGQIEAGKDTLAELIVRRLGNHWQRCGFADPIKVILCRMFGVSRCFVEEWKRRSEPPPGWRLPVRNFLQELGEMGRRYDEDVWVRQVLDMPGFRVVADGRHLNEYEHMARRGHETILVWRPGKENADPHPSESQLTPIRDEFIARGVRGPTGHPFVKHFVVNDGDPEDMLKQISSVLDRHL
jgi:hypothetical protein